MIFAEAQAFVGRRCCEITQFASESRIETPPPLNPFRVTALYGYRNRPHDDAFYYRLSIDRGFGISFTRSWPRIALARWTGGRGHERVKEMPRRTEAFPRFRQLKC
jgi:hypothetical protein